MHRRWSRLFDIFFYYLFLEGLHSRWHSRSSSYFESNDNERSLKFGILVIFLVKRRGIVELRRLVRLLFIISLTSSDWNDHQCNKFDFFLLWTGLILSLPLSPNSKCNVSSNDHDFNSASQSNKITYTVPVNGYYFFVFNSENEVQDNYIRVKFDIHKTVYNVSNSIQSCNNATKECRLSLNFFSNEKVVFELPINSNETLWNEEYVVISECEPRTLIYLICVVSVPMLILLFAFQ